MNTEKLKNQYFLLRHGISQANEAGVIVSRPENGTLSRWGLSKNGRADTHKKLAPEAIARLCPGFTRENILVLSSDFSRALETAQIFCELNELRPAQIDIRLRERSFGKLELESVEKFSQVWNMDAQTQHTRIFNCESTRQVADRLSGLLEDCESKYTGHTIVLVTHGDPSQIMQTIVQNLRPNQHREVPHMHNAELRAINQGESIY